MADTRRGNFPVDAAVPPPANDNAPWTLFGHSDGRARECEDCSTALAPDTWRRAAKGFSGRWNEPHLLDLPSQRGEERP
jgi:hypothetical protein